MSEWIDIGEQLREARESKNLALMDVAHKTRVPLATLSALEKNDYSIFPSPAYARSFLAQYSDYLNVDAHDWIDAFETGDILSNVKEHSYLQAEHDHIGDHHRSSVQYHHRNKSAHRYERMSAKVSEKSNVLQTLTVFFVTTLLIAGGIYAYKKYEPMLTGSRADELHTLKRSQTSTTASINDEDPGNSVPGDTPTDSIPPLATMSELSSSLIAHNELPNSTGSRDNPADPKNRTALQAPVLIQPNRSGPPPKALVVDERED